MIDLHCHILPGLDDGAQDLQEALDMARIAVQDGITDIVATPHTQNGLYNNDAHTILQATEHFQAALDDAQIPLQVHAGSEVHIHFGLLEHVLRSEVLTVCNQRKYLLVELPVLNLPRDTDDLLHELRVAGITPIIAHPERNVMIQRKPELLGKWIEKGALAQLTADTLLGRMGKKMQVFATFLVQKHLVHVIASDAHNIRTRRPKLRAAYQRLSEVAGHETSTAFRETSKAILQGRPCTVPEPFHERKRQRFHWFS
ncbi:MAG: tyrosine-protein phosphatase [Tumebacillaceae bacterium]